MVKQLFILIFLCLPVCIFAQEQEENSVPPSFHDKNTTQKEAQFPGGQSELYKFIAKNMKYPPVCMDYDISSRVDVQFVVSASGKVQDLKILRNSSQKLDFIEEVQRIFRIMPDWIPAEENGKPVATYYRMPITFRLD